MPDRKVYTLEELSEFLHKPQANKFSLVQPGELFPYKGCWFEVDNLEDDGVLLNLKSESKPEAFTKVEEGDCWNWKGYGWEVLEKFDNGMKIQPFMKLAVRKLSKRQIAKRKKRRK